MSIDSPHGGGEEQKVEVGTITNINGLISVEFKLPEYFSRFAKDHDNEAAGLITEANKEIGANDWDIGQIKINGDLNDIALEQIAVDDGWETVIFHFENDGLEAPLSKVFGGESSPAKILNNHLETVLQRDPQARYSGLGRGGPHVV